MSSLHDLRASVDVVSGVEPWWIALKRDRALMGEFLAQVMAIRGVVGMRYMALRTPRVEVEIAVPTEAFVPTFSKTLRETVKAIGMGLLGELTDVHWSTVPPRSTPPPLPKAKV